MTTFREFSSVVNTSDGYLLRLEDGWDGKGPPALNRETGTLSLYDISGGARGWRFFRCGESRPETGHNGGAPSLRPPFPVTSPAGEGRGRTRLPIQRMALRLRRGKIGVKHTYRLLEKRDDGCGA